MPVKQNIPIWSVMWFHGSLDPSCSSCDRRAWRISIILGEEREEREGREESEVEESEEKSEEESGKTIGDRREGGLGDREKKRKSGRMMYDAKVQQRRARRQPPVRGNDSGGQDNTPALSCQSEQHPCFIILG